MHSALPPRWPRPTATSVLPLNCTTMTVETLDKLLQTLLYEFPIREIAVQMPAWVTMLESGHWLQSAVYTSMLDFAASVHRMADLAGKRPQLGCEYITAASLTGMDLASGSVSITAAVAPDIFYKILGEQTGLDIVDEASLLPCVVSLARAKRAYDKIKSALDQVEATGYGIVMPGIDELTLEEPEIVRQGGQYGVRLSASAPSLHIMRANIHTELSPTVGSEQQGEELIKSLLADFETDPGKLWSTNIFGKSLNELVSEGVQAKLLHMPQEARSRLQQTLERINQRGLRRADLHSAVTEELCSDAFPGRSVSAAPPGPNWKRPCRHCARTNAPSRRRRTHFILTS